MNHCVELAFDTFLHENVWFAISLIHIHISFFSLLLLQNEMEVWTYNRIDIIMNSRFFVYCLFEWLTDHSDYWICFNFNGSKVPLANKNDSNI